MKRTIVTLGVVGLGLMGATVAANAAPPDKITICHATGSESHPYLFETISLNALPTHVGAGDIVPVNLGQYMPQGQNLSPENIALLANGCVEDPVTSPPVTSPPVPSPPVTSPPADPVPSPPADPVDQPVAPPVVTPVVPPAGAPAAPVASPVVTPVVPPAGAPAAPVPAAVIPAAADAGAAAAPAVAATNVGYNVQTAVGGKAGTGIPGWLAGLTGLFGAVAAFVVVRSGVRARKADR